MRKDEHGYIVVETVLAFLLYVLAILSILTLVNITVIQSRVHYAITEACETVSMYCYILDATGQADKLTSQASAAQQTEASVDEIVNNLNELIDAGKNLNVSGVQNSVSGIKSAASEINVQNVLATLVQDVEDAIFAQCMSSLVQHYLNNKYGSGGAVTQSGEEYLEAFGVEDGLSIQNFMGNYHVGFSDSKLSVSLGTDGSSMLDANGDVTIAVNYEIDYSFGGLQLPFKNLSVRQVVKTKAWLGGEGDGYGD